MKRLIVFTLLFCVASANSYAGYCVNGKQGVKSSAMITKYLTDLADNSSGFAVVASVGKTDIVETGNSKHITAILITENASWGKDSGKPTVIITGAIHGNEWATPEVSIGIAEYLLANKDSDDSALDDKGALINEEAAKAMEDDQQTAIIPRLTSIKQLLKNIQVIIIPVSNPDGYDYSQTSEGKKSYYGAGWRPNRFNQKVLVTEEICYRPDGNVYETVPADAEHCFLADYDDTSSGGEMEEEEVVVCETVDRKNLRLFEPTLNVSSAEMFDAIYQSTNPKRVVCASGDRRIWKAEWSDNNEYDVDLARANDEGYLQDAYGVDINRNFQYKWDVVSDQKHLFIRTRSPSSRMYRGTGKLSEKETSAMEKIVAQRNVVALIDYHAGSTQVLYPYAYSPEARVDRNILSGPTSKNDYEIFRLISGKIASLLNRHDRGDPSIVNFTAAQNYNDTSVGSGVARDCYYQTEGIAAINIEVHDKRYTYEESEFKKVVPEICKTNVPGAIWFLFWAAELKGKPEQ